MQKFVIFLLLLSSSSLFAQENRIDIVGTISNGEFPIENIHIVNKTSKKGAISTKEGKFRIPVREKDTLFISGLIYKTKYLIISKSNIEKNTIFILLQEKSFDIPEVIIDHRSIFYVDKSIYRAGETVTNKSLGLPNQNNKPKQTIDSIGFNLGLLMSLNIEAIYRRINGDFKKLKKLNNLKKESNYLQKIRARLGDSFFIEELQIPQDSIQPFFNSFDTKKIIRSYKDNHVLQLIKLLLWQSEKYKQLLKPE